MTLKLCTVCGEPCAGSRCDQHRPLEQPKAKTTARGYGHAWQKLSRRARELQPWCSDCGTTEDLTTDHLRWPATTLKDVDVLCRPCNASKGKPDDSARPGEKALNEWTDDPRGKANLLIQTLVQRRSRG